MFSLVQLLIVSVRREAREGRSPKRASLRGRRDQNGSSSVRAPRLDCSRSLIRERALAELWRKR